MRLLLSLLPLAAFWLIEPAWGLRAAILAGMVLVAVELAYTRVVEGRFSRFTLFSAGLVAVLGGLSLASDDARFALLAPAVGDLVLAAVLVGTRLAGRNVLVLALAEQEPELQPHPLQVRFLDGLVARLAVNLVLHAALVAWAAGQPRETWLLVSGPVQYGMLGLQVLAEVAWGRLVVLPRVEADEEGSGAP